MAEEKTQKGTDALAACTDKDLEAFDLDFSSNPKNELAMNIVTQTALLKAALSRKARLTHDHVYSVSIPDEAKPVCAQNSTGRCWLFAALNVMRIPFMKEHKLDEFQFSQSYLFFWDHFERCNFFLEQILDTLSEPLDGRLVQYLLSKPIEDGGQYDMIVNLVEKYGVVPRQAFPEVEVTQASRRLNWLLKNKLREFAMVLRKEANKTPGKYDMNQLRQLKKKQLNEIWRIMIISFGKPPQKIKYAFRNKDKEYNVLEYPNEWDNVYFHECWNICWNECWFLVHVLYKMIGMDRQETQYILYEYFCCSSPYTCIHMESFVMNNDSHNIFSCVYLHQV
eukprot:57448_1